MNSNLSWLMKRKRKTQYDVALALGVSKSTVFNWANNKSYPAFDKAVELSVLLDCTLYELYDMDWEGYPE